MTRRMHAYGKPSGTLCKEPRLHISSWRVASVTCLRCLALIGKRSAAELHAEGYEVAPS